MEIILNKDIFLKNLQLLEPIVSSRSALPISMDVLIKTEEKNKCVLIGTDIETSLKIEIPCKILKPGEICVPAKKLVEAVRELTEEEILFRSKESNVFTAEILCGKTKDTFVGQSSKNHPGMPLIDEKQKKANLITIDPKIFQDAFVKTVFATSKEETRYYLNGVYVNIQKDVAKFVSTDGRRLSYLNKKIDNNKVVASGIVPTKAIYRTIDIIEKSKPKTIKFSILQDNFVLETDEITFISRLVQGEFPAYDQVIPKNLPQITVNIEKFKKALKQVSWVTPEKGLGIRLLFKNNILKFFASVESIGVSEVEIDISYNDKELEVKFEPEFILDVLSVLSNETDLIIGLNEETSPWIFQAKNDSDYLYILMPMKLQ